MKKTPTSRRSSSRRRPMRRPRLLPILRTTRPRSRTDRLHQNACRHQGKLATVRRPGPRCSNYGLWDGTSLASGYEYYLLERDNAIYKTNRPSGPFTQPDTTTNQIEFGPSTRWSRSFETFVRYRLQFIEDPLVGVSEYSIDDPDINGTFNSNQPQQVHNVDIGYKWSPYCNFMTTAQVTIRNSWNDSQYSPTSPKTITRCRFTAWYAPTDRLSFTGGYAYYSNWIDQDITLGANRGIPPDTETTRWNYAGRKPSVHDQCQLCLERCVQLMAGYEWDRGTNIFEVPPSPNPGVDWSLLPSLSDVIVETQRFTTGIDWKPYHDTNVYLRYVFYDYNDISSNLNSGTAHMVLGGSDSHLVGARKLVFKSGSRVPARCEYRAPGW